MLFRSFFLLITKHYFVDFYLQTPEMVRHKGIYGDQIGLEHSIEHSVGTFLVTILFVNIFAAIAVALLDLVIHYHIDFVKAKYGAKDETTKAFWFQFGLDQYLHFLTYIIFFYFVMWLY